MKNISILTVFVILCISVVYAQVPTTIDDFFLPGSQPLQSGSFSQPASCSCHQYDIEVEAYFGWEGSMMAQSMRDQLFLATLSIANQDAESSGDLCLRCHTPTGWLSGRSEPTDGSSLIAEDYTGVNCLFCHRMVMPTDPAVNPFPSDPDYSNAAYSSTNFSTRQSDSIYIADQISAHVPPSSANGMFVVTDEDERRGPYKDPANPNHGFYYSPFHSISDNCATCHDVSNPAYTKNADGTYSLNELGEPAPDFSPYSMFPIERTYSEWKMSAYNTPEGISGTPFGGNKSAVSTCQDCHMKDVTGKGSSRGNSPVRTDLGLHDFTGGNTFMPLVLKTQFPGDIDPAALDSSISRATWMLKNAATMTLSMEGNELSVRIQNETGHKLPSGYPEGRRSWINVQAFNQSNQLIYESGQYNPSTGVLTYDSDVKIYEIKPGLSPSTAISLNKESGPSFHFVLNDTIYSDNRIPPRGFTNVNFEAIQSEPIGYSYADGQFWDITTYTLPEARHSVIATLYYQTTSKEYIEFLRDENYTDSHGQLMYDLWDQHGKSAPVAMVSETWEDSPSAINTSEDNRLLARFPDLKIIGPNPFNSQIHFEYSVVEHGPVDIVIYNIYGERIAVLVNQVHEKGDYRTYWQANDKASGTYFVRLNSNHGITTRKIILLK